MKTHSFNLRVKALDETVPVRMVQDKILEALGKDAELNRLLDNKNIKLTLKYKTA